MFGQIPCDGGAITMWRRCLGSAFRTALACSIVGVSTLYGPTAFNCQVAFPAFSYVTVILVSTDATLGDTLRGCWLALYATAQGVGPAILSLWLIGPGSLTATTTAAVVAVSAFVVALPEKNTHLVSKRIALGQIVIVYTIAFYNGGETETVMHPVHVAASTAVGVVACVLALLLPYPSLACWEVRENCKHYNENASKRLKLYAKAFTADDRASQKALISQAKSLNKPATKFLQSIKSKQESMRWEIIPFMFFKSNDQKPGENLQNLDTILRGMEKALENCSEFPIGILNSELKNNLITFSNRIINLANLQTNTFLQTLQIQTDTKISPQNLPSLFFIFCLKLLIQTESSAKHALNQDSPKNKIQSKIWQNITIHKKRLMPAFKCALSLGFAVLFGSLYSKENAIWSGLPVAISLASAREATFKVANSKAQGTVFGTVYGVLGCFVFNKYEKLRFISLLPWFIFSNFLRQSKMYGQAGGVSAVIGAVLILGRKNFGKPSDFAIARIVETFIGLSCSIMVDILFQPTRASVLAKTQLSKTLHALRECVSSITITGSSSGKLVSAEKNLNNLKYNLNELGKFIEEAGVEPDFWFMPFHSDCYGKLRVSFSRMVDFLIFGGHAIRILEKESEKMDSKIWKEAVVELESDLKVSRDAVCWGIKCLEEVSLVKSLVVLEREYGEKRKSDADLEKGKSGNVFFDDDEMKESETSFLEKLDEIVSDVTKEEVKNEVVLSLSSLVYCMDGLLRESKEVEKGIKEILQWDNPSVQVDLHDIVCKMHAMEVDVK